MDKKHIFAIFIALLMSLMAAAQVGIIELSAAQTSAPVITIKTLNFFPPDYEAAQVVYSELKSLGLNVQLLEEGPAELYPEVQTNHNFTIYLNAYSASPFPSLMFEAFQSWNNYPNGYDITGFDNSTLDALTNETLQASNNTAFIQGLYKMEEIVAQQLPMIGLYNDINTQLVSKAFEGYVVMPGGEFTQLNPWSAMELHPANNQSGGYFTLAYPADLEHLNPFAQTSVRGEFVTLLIYDPLFRYAPNLSIIPWLVTNYTITNGGKTYILNLRNNVTFQNGQPLTAQDVAFTYNFILKNKAPLFYDFVDMINNISTVGNYTVVFHLSQPYAGLLSAMTTIPIVPESIWYNKNLSWPNPDPIGSGPFMFESRVPGQSIQLVANPHYWLKGYPKLSGFNIMVVDQESVRVLDIEKGIADAELYATPPSLAASALSSYPNSVEVLRSPDLWMMYLYFNLRVYPTNNIHFRQAIAYAINKTAVVDAYGGGYPMPNVFVTQQWNPGMINPNLPNYSYNPTLAHQLLVEYGFIPSAQTNNSTILYVIIGVVVVIVGVVAGIILRRR
jgi:peptide/nickel transport system substrate-binding protein